MSQRARMKGHEIFGILKKKYQNHFTLEIPELNRLMIVLEKYQKVNLIYGK